jgi:hypothetical protein
VVWRWSQCWNARIEAVREDRQPEEGSSLVGNFLQGGRREYELPAMFPLLDKRPQMTFNEEWNREENY